MNNLDAPDALDVQSHCRVNRLLYVYNATPPVGRWVHVAVRIRTDGTCWFVDGKKQICNSNYITNTNVTGKDFSFGCVVNVQGYAPYADGYSNYSRGMFDEFYIFSHALNDTEIQKFYSGLNDTKPFYLKTIGGTEGSEPRFADFTMDGGVIVAGGTGSFGILWGDIFVTKLDAAGRLDWAKTIGGGDADRGPLGLGGRPYNCGYSHA